MLAGERRERARQQASAATRVQSALRGKAGRATTMQQRGVTPSTGSGAGSLEAAGRAEAEIAQEVSEDLEARVAEAARQEADEAEMARLRVDAAARMQAKHRGNRARALAEAKAEKRQQMKQMTLQVIVLIRTW